MKEEKPEPPKDLVPWLLSMPEGPKQPETNSSQPEDPLNGVD